MIIIIFQNSVSFGVPFSAIPYKDYVPCSVFHAHIPYFEFHFEAYCIFPNYPLGSPSRASHAFSSTHIDIADRDDVDVYI